MRLSMSGLAGGVGELELVASMRCDGVMDYEETIRGSST
jgi:hypothetical protein